MANNVSKIAQLGMCVGCGACDGCEHISVETNLLGFPTPVIDENCTQCGECLSNCIYNPENED